MDKRNTSSSSYSSYQPSQASSRMSTALSRTISHPYSGHSSVGGEGSKTSRDSNRPPWAAEAGGDDGGRRRAEGERRFSSVRERRIEERRQSRVAVGLLPDNMPLSIRETMDVTMGYRDAPPAFSRSALLRARRVAHLEGLETSRQLAGNTFVAQADRLKMREDCDHRLRDSNKRVGDDLKHASVNYILKERKKDNTRDLMSKWQHHIDSKNAVDPNTHVSSEDRPAFWTLRDTYKPQCTFATRSELLQSRRNARHVNLAQTFPSQKFFPPPDSLDKIWSSKPRAASWQ